MPGFTAGRNLIKTSGVLATYLMSLRAFYELFKLLMKTLAKTFNLCLEILLIVWFKFPTLIRCYCDRTLKLKYPTTENCIAILQLYQLKVHLLISSVCAYNSEIIHFFHLMEIDTYWIDVNACKSCTSQGESYLRVFLYVYIFFNSDRNISMGLILSHFYCTFVEQAPWHFDIHSSICLSNPISS